MIWCGPTQQIFCGAPGSGKTILLQHKALECAKKQEFVVVFVPPPLDSLYRIFFEQNQVLSKYVHTIPYTDLENFVSMFPRDVKKCHIFIDEFQVLLNTNQELLDSLIAFMSHNYDHQYYQWVVYDNLHVPMASEVHGIKSSRVDVVHNLTTLQENGFTHAPSLTTVMRNTSEVYKFLHTYLENYSNYSGVKGSMIAASHAFNKYWKHSIYPGHRVSGPGVTVKPYADREPPFKVIHDEIQEWAKENDKYHFRKVAVLMAFSGLISELKQHLQRHGVPVCLIGSTENAVVVDSPENARSYEWPVVIAIIANVKSMQNYISYSHAVSRLVTILWKPV